MSRGVHAKYRAAAPVRLDLAGGWTDVPPFSEREGGLVVTAAIRLFAHADVVLGGSSISLIAEDLGDRIQIRDAADLAGDGRLDLLKAGLRLLPVGCCTLATRSDVPPGSGLGSSGALDAALVAALSAARGERLGPREVAERAWRLEAVEAGMAGGKQDQFSAAYGGFQCIRFRDPDVQLEPLALDAAFAQALQRQMILCYTGASRFSGATISRVMAAYQRGDARVARALHGIRAAAQAMAEALRASDPVRVGALLSENWTHQQALDPSMRTTEMARLEQIMLDAGVLGGKAAGSGAGGSMFFLAGDRPELALAAARAAGAQVLPVAWATEGVCTW